MINVNVDLMGLNGKVSGEVATYLNKHGKLDPGTLRPFLGSDGRTYVTIYSGSGDPKKKENYVTFQLQANATLRRDEWKALDDVVIQVSRERLGGIQDLRDKGLVYNLGNAMGTTVLESHDVSDAMEAVVTMDGITRGNADRPEYGHNYLPIPIIHVDFEINTRELEASRNMSNPIDTTSAESAARKVNEKLEDMLFTNSTYSFGEKDSRNRNTIYSYLNYPDRNQVSLAKDWVTTASAAEIVADVTAMKKESMDNYHYGPWMLYIPAAYETRLDEDYSVSGGSLQTIRDRIMKISGIIGIKVVDRLTAGNVLLVQMTSDTVRIVNGMGIQTVQWKEEGQFITKYKVMTIQVPQIRSDYNRKSGIVHLA